MTGTEFIFRKPAGEEVGRAGDLNGFENSIETLPLESIEYHHANRHFTPWLQDHNHSKLAKKIEKEKSSGERLRKKLSKAVKRELEKTAAG